MILFLSDLYFIAPFIHWVFLLGFQIIYFLRLNLRLKKKYQAVIFHTLGIQQLSLIFTLVFSIETSFTLSLFNNTLIFHDFLKRMDLLVLLISLAYLVSIYKRIYEIRLYSIEIAIYFQICLFGLLIITRCANILVFYISFELQAFCLYALALLKKHSIISSESGLKYFLTGALASSIFALGCSFVYGFFGNLSFLDLKVITENKPYYINLYSFFLLVLFFYKLGIFPFNQWMPDVYEASRTIITFFFSFLPKVVYFLALIMVFNFWLSLNVTSIVWVLAIFSLVTIVQSSIFALNQVKVKRFLTYSGMVQFSYILLSLSLDDLVSLFSSVFFLAIYLLGVFSVWNLILKMNTKRRIFYLTDFIGLHKFNSLFAMFFLSVILSFAGLPPFTGFFSKILIFYMLLEKNSYLVVLILILTSALTVFYYLKLSYLIYFKGLSNYLYNFLFLNMSINHVKHGIFLLSIMVFLICTGMLNTNFVNLFIYKILLMLLN